MYFVLKILGGELWSILDVVLSGVVLIVLVFVVSSDGGVFVVIWMGVMLIFVFVRVY